MANDRDMSGSLSKNEHKGALTIHPLADIFPPMAEEAYTALVADMRENGQQEAIILFEGKVLDGRNRLRACIEIGEEPLTKVWDGRGDPLDYVVSKNLHRRHLSESQRAMVADKIANMKAGDNQVTPIGGTSQAQAAAMLNVGHRSVQRARQVRTNGVRALQQAVEAGGLSVSVAAEIAQQPEVEQMSIMAYGPQAVRAAKVITGSNAIKVPAGMTLEQVCRNGLAIEKAEPGTSIEAVADRIKISTQSYSMARTIVLLADRDDLSKADKAVVKAALDDMRATNQLKRADEMVRPVAEKCWGKGKARKTDKKINKRIERYELSIEVVIGACTGLNAVEIPHIPAVRAKERIRDLQEMKGLLTESINRLKEFCE